MQECGGVRLPLIAPRPQPRVRGLAPSSPPQLLQAQRPSRWTAAFPLFPANSNSKAPCARSLQQRRRPPPASSCRGPPG